MLTSIFRKKSCSLIFIFCTTDKAPEEKNKGVTLQLQQFRAMFQKRVIHSWRNRLVTITQLLVPFCFTLVGCVILESFPGPRDPPAVELTLGHYKEPVAPYSINQTSNNGTYDLKLALTYRDFIESQSARAPLVNEISGYEDNPDMDTYLGDIGAEDFDAYSRYYMTAAVFVGDHELGLCNETSLAVAYFNNEAFHTTATTLSMASNAILQCVMGSDYSVTAANHPLPRESSTVVEEEIDTSSIMGFIVAYQISFGMAFVVGSFILFLIKERVTKSKHIQFASGVNVFNFWMSTFTWDMINYLIPCLLLFPVFAIFGVDAFIEGTNAG